MGLARQEDSSFELSFFLSRPSLEVLIRLRDLAAFVGDSDWEDDVEGLLRDTVASAGFRGSGPEGLYQDLSPARASSICNSG